MDSSYLVKMTEDQKSDMEVREHFLKMAIDFNKSQHYQRSPQKVSEVAEIFKQYIC